MISAARGVRTLASLALVAAGLVSAGSPTAAADTVRSREYWLDDYGIRAAWNTTTGAGQRIAIIDTGIGAGVPEMVGAVVGGTDFSGVGSADGRTPVGSESEHGTLVASLAAGRGTGPNSGVIGSAPGASLLAISISFQGDSDNEIAKAVRWAVDHGATVINMSLTRNTLDWPQSWDDAFLYAMDHNVVVVAAAGNRGSGTEEVGAPATMPGVLTVAGVDTSGHASTEASAQGITIGVAAPSENLVGVMPGGAHVTWQGTSGATPIVAGVVALVRAAHPKLDAANVINRIVKTAHDAGPRGPDVTYGYGLLDANAAVTARVAPVTANPMGDLREWVRVNRRATPAPSAATTLIPVPQTEAARPAWNPVGVLYPSPALLAQAGPPTVLILVIGFVLVGFTVGAVRYFRWARRNR